MSHATSRNWRLLVLALAALALAVSGHATDEDECLPHQAICADTAWSPDGSCIAFSSDAFSPLNLDICIVNADGSGLQRLIDDPADDRYPTWNPEGNRIAFSSERSGKPQVYTMNVDGTGLQPLGSFGRGACDPAWSPDGSRIAVVVETGPGQDDTNIQCISPDGLQLGWLAASSEQESAPSWSPDGQKLVYCTPSGIVRRNADRSAEVRLTSRGPNGKWIESQPVWSRQSDRIAYSTVAIHDSDGALSVGDVRIYVMNADGASPLPLFSTEPLESSSHPSWSPTQDKIAFVGTTDSGDHIFVVNSDGTGLTQVTHSAGLPGFSPAGGSYDSSVAVTITSTPGCSIHYTLDGTDPTQSSPLYSGPIMISGSTVLAARAYKSGCFPSGVSTAEYTIE